MESKKSIYEGERKRGKLINIEFDSKGNRIVEGAYHLSVSYWFPFFIGIGLPLCITEFSNRTGISFPNIAYYIPIAFGIIIYLFFQRYILAYYYEIFIKCPYEPCCTRGKKLNSIEAYNGDRPSRRNWRDGSGILLYTFRCKRCNKEWVQTGYVFNRFFDRFYPIHRLFSLLIKKPMLILMSIFVAIIYWLLSSTTNSIHDGNGEYVDLFVFQSVSWNELSLSGNDFNFSANILSNTILDSHKIHAFVRKFDGNELIDEKLLEINYWDSDFLINYRLGISDSSYSYLQYGIMLTRIYDRLHSTSGELALTSKDSEGSARIYSRSIDSSLNRSWLAIFELNPDNSKGSFLRHRPASKNDIKISYDHRKDVLTIKPIL